MTEFNESAYKIIKGLSRPYVYLGIVLITIFLTSLTVSSYIDEFRNDRHFKLPLSAFTESKPPNKSARSVDQIKPRSDENQIYFVESSCGVSPKGYNTSEPAVHLNNIQLCAIESAARANPDSVISLLYTCPMDSESLNRSSDIVQTVFRAPNVQLWHESVGSVADGTPLAGFEPSGALRWSFYPTLHASEVLRTLLLWKYGGTYLDLDVVSMRPFSDLGSEFVALQDTGVLSFAAVRLSSSRLGKGIAGKFVESIRDEFQGHLAKYNGADMVARVVKEYCPEVEVEMLGRDKCGNLTVLPRHVFHAKEWKKVDEEQQQQQQQDTNLIAGGEEFTPHAIHLKTLLGAFGAITPESKQLLDRIMQEFCPNVFASRHKSD